MKFWRDNTSCALIWFIHYQIAFAYESNSSTQVVVQSYKSEQNICTLCRILLGIWCTSASFVLLLYLHHLMVLGYDFLKWWHKHSYNIITILLNKTKALLSITKDVYRLPCFGDIVIDSRLRFLRKFSTLPLYFLHKASNCRITYKAWRLTKISQWMIYQ